MRNLKRALSLAVASVMLLGMMVVGTSASYPDVDAQDNLEAIEVLQLIGVMDGDDNGNFNPDQIVTRNEMAVVITELLGAKPSGTSPFTDVADWAQGYVNVCYTRGIVTGDSATSYGGDRGVSTVEAALMVLRTLGYFEYEGEYGEDWKISTIKKAYEAALFDGINSGVTDGLTRNEVAKLVLNALEADVKAVTEQGGLSVEGNGISVNSKPTYTYADTFTTENYKGAAGTRNTQQLAEKLYGSDLKKENDTTDEFGRPSAKWTYNNESVISPKAADLTYTSGVKGKDVYTDLGKPAIEDTFYSVDGDDEAVIPAGFAVASGNDKKVGADGQTIEVYYDKDTKSVTIVVINYYIDEITSVDTKDGDRIVKIGSDEYVTKAFDEGDMVIYTKIAGGDIKSMVPAEKLTGTITKLVGTNEYYIDGVKYKTSSSAGADLDDTVAVKDDVDYYLANGYIIKIDKADEAVNVDDLAYVADAGSTRGDWATLILADGTKKVVDTDKNYESLKGYIVSFKSGSNGYELKAKSETSLPVDGSANTFTKGEPTLTVLGEPDANVTVNSQTVFVYALTKTEDDITSVDKYVSYTGYKNAPGLDDDAASKIVFYRESESKAAVMVYIEIDKDDLATASKDLTFVIYDKDVKRTDDGDNQYYEYNAVVDGKITTIQIEDQQWSNVSSNAVSGFEKVSSNDDGVATDLTPADGKYTTATTSEAVKGDVITLDSQALAYADDVKVFVVDSKKNISAGTINSLKQDNDGTKDPYEVIVYTQNDDNEVDLLILVQN